MDKLRAGVPVETRTARDDETAPNGEEFHVQIVASSEAVARDGGVIPMEAWKDGGLAAFRQNPVVLFAHKHRRLPVAKAVQTEVREGVGTLVEWWRFHGETDLSRQLKELYSRGFMKAASVGFRVLDSVTPTSQKGKKILDEVGVDAGNVDWVATNAELLETSAVAVPADPEALAVEQALKDASLRRVETDAVRQKLDEMRKACRNGDTEACRRLDRAAAEDSVEIEVRDSEAARDAVRRLVDGVIADRLLDGEEVVEVERRPGETKRDAIERWVETQLGARHDLH